MHRDIDVLSFFLLFYFIVIKEWYEHEMSDSIINKLSFIAMYLFVQMIGLMSKKFI